MSPPGEMRTVETWLQGKSDLTIELFTHFFDQFSTIGPVTLHPAKSMMGIALHGQRIAWVTALGKNFVHVVFPFKKPCEDNLCFQKIASVPGDDQQFNHHFRMLAKEDVNEEVLRFMKLACTGE